MLHFEINNHSGLPVYRQMIDQVKYYVASGALKVGDKLPAIRELAAHLTINPTTVVRVYSELERERVIEVMHGKGAFIAASSVRMSSAERGKKLHELARHLAVETSQMGIPATDVLSALKDELEDLHESKIIDLPVKAASRGRA